MCRPTRTAIRPGCEPADDRSCGVERAGRRRKREEERIALRVHLDAVRGRARVPDHATVLGQRLRVPLGAELVQQTRRALDVGEQERDRA